MIKLLTAVLPLCLLLTGCSDKVAREYATQLTSLMYEYGKRVDHLIDGETRRYEEEAQALESAREETTLDKLSEDRRTVVTKKYLDGLVEGSADARTLVNSVLLDYAEKDHTATREIYTKLDGAYMDHLKNMQPLAADKAKTKVLRSAFADLAKEPDVMAIGKQLIQFRADLKSNLEFERCSDVDAEVTSLTASATGLTAKINALAAGAPERKALEETLKTTNADLAAAIARRAGTGRYDETSKQCKRP